MTADTRKFIKRLAAAGLTVRDGRRGRYVICAPSGAEIGAFSDTGLSKGRTLRLNLEKQCRHAGHPLA